ncbi:MAG: hypothetical protein AAF089_19215, partial [Bacteroidota bacterium]
SIRKRYVAVLLVPLFLWVAVLAASEPNAADAPSASLPPTSQPPVSLPLPDPIECDLDAIRAGDTLTMLMTYNTGHGHAEDARRLHGPGGEVRLRARPRTLHLRGAHPGALDALPVVRRLGKQAAPGGARPT